MCPVPISRKYLDVLVNYIHEFLGIKVEKVGADYKFVSVEINPYERKQATYTTKDDTSYYHYLNCIYKIPETLYKPKSPHKYPHSTSYLFKEWNCDGGCLSMIVEPEKMNRFVDSLEEDCRNRYTNKEIEECYDLSLKPSTTQPKTEYGRVFKSKPDLIMKLYANSKVSVIANGFSDNSKVTILSILRFEQAYDIETARIYLNRIMMCKYIFNTANAFSYHSSIRPVVNDPLKLFSQVIHSDFGLCIYTKPIIQYHAAVRLATLISVNNEDEDLNDLESLEDLMNKDERKSESVINEWRNTYSKAITDFETKCDTLNKRFKDVRDMDSSGGKDKDSVYSVYLHMNDIGRAVITLLECIKPDISKDDKVLITNAYKIPDVKNKTTSFYTYGKYTKYYVDLYEPNIDVVTKTVVKDEDDKLVWGNKRLHHDRQQKRYPDIINNKDTIVEDVLKFFNDMLLPNVEFAIAKHFKPSINTRKDEDGDNDDSEEDVEEETIDEYEIPNCDWLFKIYQLTKTNYANSDIQQYINTVSKNILIRLRNILNK